ncbi:YoaK family protein [Nocardioides plantarum]|uniref:YoaK family protein n=1 Tax=Nocardioides plantarum TaxID=29299 RepID=A0ABV5K5J0_9ACTN|nr:YoaK family protein [Nocardioides plantarum]
MTSWASRVSREQMHLSLMLVLTFGTGIIDAVGYLGLDRVFTGNMTGNVVIIGMAAVGADDLPLLGPLLALAGFLVGATIGGRVLRTATSLWSRRTTLLFASVGVTELGLAGALLATGEDPGKAFEITITTLLGAAMGVQAATARFVAVKDVTTVVVTSTLTGLAADSVLGSGKGGGSGRRALAVVLIITGAAVGALLLRWHLAAGLVLAGGVVLACTLVGAWHDRLVPDPSGQG